jgi:maleate cis-trans isomerase
MPAAPVLLGILVPPGNPTVASELARMAPPGLALTYAPLEPGPEHGPAGAAEGMEARTRSYLEHLAGPAAALAVARPALVALAHTACSYLNGFAAEGALAERLSILTGAPALTAAQAVGAALERLGARAIALGTPYPEAISARARAYWEAAGFRLAGYHRLAALENIYTAHPSRARELARGADAPDAEAIVLSGTGLPTLDALEPLERELGKPVVSSNQALLWRALELVGVETGIEGFGSLLRLSGRRER